MLVDGWLGTEMRIFLNISGLRAIPVCCDFSHTFWAAAFGCLLELSASILPTDLGWMSPDAVLLRRARLLRWRP